LDPCRVLDSRSLGPCEAFQPAGLCYRMPDRTRRGRHRGLWPRRRRSVFIVGGSRHGTPRAEDGTLAAGLATTASSTVAPKTRSRSPMSVPSPMLLRRQSWKLRRRHHQEPGAGTTRPCAYRVGASMPEATATGWARAGVRLRRSRRADRPTDRVGEADPL